MKMKKIVNNFIIFFLIIELFFFVLSFAQVEGFQQQIDKQISNFIGAIITMTPIIIIVLILLYLGGILRTPRTGTNWLFILYLILIVIIFVLPILQRVGVIHIFPDDPEQLFEGNVTGKKGFEVFKQYELPKIVCNVFTTLTISRSIACYMPAFLYFFILPFAAIYAITWAFLKQIRIFEGLGRNIEGLIAFIITFMTLPMGTFILLVALWFSIAGAFSVAIFIAMFLAGVFLRGYGFIKEKHFEYVGKRAKEEHIKKVTNTANWAIDRINRANDIDDIIRAIEWFMDKTGYYADYAKIDEIRKKPLADAKTEAEKLIRDLASKAS